MGLQYISIRALDLKKTVNFYTRLMGIKIIGKRSYMPGEQIIMLEDKGTKQRMNIMHYTKSCKLYTPWKKDGVELDHLMFVVKDAKKMYAKLVKMGFPSASELWENENVQLGFIKDPNGIWVGLRTEKRKTR